MRLTAKNAGPCGKHIMVFLNDKLVPGYAITVADEEQGIIEAFLLNDRGKKYLSDGAPAMETLRGLVDILLKPNATEAARKYFEWLRKERAVPRNDSWQ